MVNQKKIVGEWHWLKRIFMGFRIKRPIPDTEQKCPYDSKWDATDAACPAFWRGEKYSANQFCRLITDVLSGKNNCTGRMNEPLETVRNNVFKLKQEWEIAWDRNHDLENLAGKYLEEIEALKVERDT